MYLRKAKNLQPDVLGHRHLFEVSYTKQKGLYTNINSFFSPGTAFCKFTSHGVIQVAPFASQREFCLISVGPDFTFNYSFDTHAGASSAMLWIGIVQWTKQEGDTLIIETLPSPLQALSSQSTLKMLVCMLLPSLKMYNKTHLNEDSKEFKGKKKNPGLKSIRVQF